MSNIETLKDAFIAEWGSVGPAWGMTRTVARVHALLMVSETPLTTDEIMDELHLSRGGVHGALRELVGLGIARSAVRKGERKESFAGEKDPWKVFCCIMRERKRREVEPVLAILDKCIEGTEGMKGEEAKLFTAQLERLRKFVQVGDRAMAKIGASDEKKIIRWLLGL